MAELTAYICGLLLAIVLWWVVVCELIARHQLAYFKQGERYDPESETMREL